MKTNIAYKFYQNNGELKMTGSLNFITKMFSYYTAMVSHLCRGHCLM